MYNFGGIIHLIKYNGISVFVLGIIDLIFCLMKNHRVPKKDFWILLLIFTYVLVYIGLHMFFIASPQVLVFEGTLIEEHRTSSPSKLSPFISQYTFENPDFDKDRFFYLDVDTMKEVFPGDLQIGTEYRIYYEEHTRFIVKVETIDN